ncbi:MAG: cbb3-type cytochrome c oxidase subunit 3 [Gammaproteobacteria bacterium]|nr:cbb3-type cytochrome c oxidase subunit 3 [Gammaproteobacteria bacterium]MCY4218513.1 cbb3-type cytochrome c oxidase subunit 3 [Gammaproteobacteria bacterium]MCY4276149.1 cbb3-type cytochrome c oxidase subunit 3 [Gammaproteobacteria bacterium]
MEVFHTIWTALLMILFVLIFIKAWSRKRVQEYHEAAHIPLREDRPNYESNKDG